VGGPAMMRRVNVLFCGSGWRLIVDFVRERLPPDITIRARDLSLPLKDEVREIDVLLPSNARIDAGVIAAAPRLSFIQQPAVGVEGIDLEAARARSIPVCNAPGSNERSVAEAALLLMLALARRMPAAQRAFAEVRIGEPLGVELGEKTLGLIGGSGRSGSRLAAAADGLGMRVLSVGRSSSRADLLELAAASDFVSVHCPLTPATRGLIGAEFFARMRPGAHLINCARGGVVDRDALLAALESGRLGGAGLDTFWSEPWDPSDPLFQRGDVIALPHVAGSTREAFARIADIVAENIGRHRRGEPLLHRIA
jgi:phosphoglycerate dehydrogenase-like enzyme